MPGIIYDNNGNPVQSNNGISLIDSAGNPITPAKEDGALQDVKTILQSRLDANLSTLSTEQQLALLNSKVIVTSNGIKVDASSITQNVSVSSSTLPTGAATESTLSSINSKITIVDTGNVVVSSSVLPTGAAKDLTLTDGSQKTKICDSTGIEISSTNNALDVSLKQSIPLDVIISHISDSILVYGNDGTSNKALNIDNSGKLNVNVSSSTLPSGAATESTLSAISSKIPALPATENGNLSNIKSNTDKLDVLLSSRASETTLSNFSNKFNTTPNGIKVDGSSVVQPISASSLPLPSGAAKDSTLIDGSQKTKIITSQGEITSTANALDVNIKSSTPINIVSDKSNSSVSIYGYDGVSQKAIKTDLDGNLSVNIVSSIDGIATNSTLTNGTTKVRVLDKDGVGIGSTNNALDVNVKSGTILNVSLDNSNDNVLVYGFDGNTNKPVKTDVNGNILSNVISSVLPSGAATESTLNAIYVREDSLAKETTLNSIDGKIPADYDSKISSIAKESTLSSLNSKIPADYSNKIDLIAKESTLSSINAKINTTPYGIKVDATSTVQPVSLSSTPLPADASRDSTLTSGNMKTKIVDNLGNEVSTTGKALDVNIKSSNITITADIDNLTDSVAVYGNDGTSNKVLKTNSNGQIEASIVSTVLPPNAASETTLNDIKNISDLTRVAVQHMDVSGVSVVSAPSNLAQASKQDDQTALLQNISNRSDAISSKTNLLTANVSGIDTMPNTYGMGNFSPNISYPIDDIKKLSTDKGGALISRAQILTDEGDFKDSFSGSLIVTSTNATSFTNNSRVVTGTGFLSLVNPGDYIKLNSDPYSSFAQINKIISDNELLLETDYAGTTGSGSFDISKWNVFISGSAAASNVSNELTIQTSAVNGDSANVYRRIDYCPISASSDIKISGLFSSCIARFGFVGSNSSCYFEFSSDFTSVKCHTNFDSESIDTIALIPGKLKTTDYHNYIVKAGKESIEFYIDEILVARHKEGINQYDPLSLSFFISNTGASSGSSTLKAKYVVVKNFNEINVDSNEISTDNKNRVIVSPFSGQNKLSDDFDLQDVNSRWDIYNPNGWATISNDKLVVTIPNNTSGSVSFLSKESFSENFSCDINGIIESARVNNAGFFVSIVSSDATAIDYSTKRQVAICFNITPGDSFSPVSTADNVYMVRIGERNSAVWTNSIIDLRKIGGDIRFRGTNGFSLGVKKHGKYLKIYINDAEIYSTDNISDINKYKVNLGVIAGSSSGCTIEFDGINFNSYNSVSVVNTLPLNVQTELNDYPGDAIMAIRGKMFTSSTSLISLATASTEYNTFMMINPVSNTKIALIRNIWFANYGAINVLYRLYLSPVASNNGTTIIPRSLKVSNYFSLSSSVNTYSNPTITSRGTYLMAFGNYMATHCFDDLNLMLYPGSSLLITSQGRANSANTTISLSWAEI